MSKGLVGTGAPKRTVAVGFGRAASMIYYGEYCGVVGETEVAGMSCMDRLLSKVNGEDWWSMVYAPSLC